MNLRIIIIMSVGVEGARRGNRKQPPLLFKRAFVWTVPLLLLDWTAIK